MIPDKVNTSKKPRADVAIIVYHMDYIMQEVYSAAYALNPHKH